jgi:hypothetical protein
MSSIEKLIRLCRDLADTFRSVLPLTRIIVSCNGEQYRVVEITGAHTGSWIRERILSKVVSVLSSWVHPIPLTLGHYR